MRFPRADPTIMIGPRAMPISSERSVSTDAWPYATSLVTCITTVASASVPMYEPFTRP